MSISLPNNKAEKWARYNMLVKQGSLTLEQAKQAYADYLRRTRLYISHGITVVICKG